MINNDFNRLKLRAIVQAFDLPVVAIAEAVGVSRPYVARLLSEKDDFTGSPQFWSSIERNLGKIIEKRHGQIFQVEALPVVDVCSLNT